MDADDLKLFRAVAQRSPPRHRVRELWVVAGRRAGKDSIASAIACYFAAFIDWRSLGLLRPGEVATCLCLATDKAQASIVEKYTRAYFGSVPLLRGLELLHRLLRRGRLLEGSELDQPGPAGDRPIEDARPGGTQSACVAGTTRSTLAVSTVLRPANAPMSWPSG